MQIHELNTFSGTPGSGDYLAIDDGSETRKISLAEYVESVAEEREVLVINVSSFSSLPKTVSDSRITSDMILVNHELGSPAAQIADWTVTTSNGSLTIGPSGAIDGSTSAKLYLMKSR